MTKIIKMRNGTNIFVDDGDFKEMNKRSWRNVAGYAATSEHWYDETDKRRTKTINMHRLINKTPQGMMTDHINGNPLDNRKCNLRLVTAQQNQWNKKTSRKTSSSKYKGVSWTKWGWRAYIQVGKKYTSIGFFMAEEDAATAYNFYAEKEHGKYAFYNINQGVK